MNIFLSSFELKQKMVVRSKYSVRCENTKIEFKIKTLLIVKSVWSPFRTSIKIIDIDIIFSVSVSMTMTDAVKYEMKNYQNSDNL